MRLPFSRNPAKPAKQHDPPILATTGTPYPILQEELDILQSRTRPPATAPHLTLPSATHQLERFHAQPRNPTAQAALSRLHELQRAPRFGADIVFKVFNDLSTVYFAGALNHNVQLSWGDCPSGGVAGTTSPAHYRSAIPRVRITLDRALLKAATTRLRDVWAVLLHEMVHAYLMVLCARPRDEDERDPGHGRHFRRCLRAVQRGLGGRRFVELGLTHRLCERVRGDPRWESGYRAVKRVVPGKRRGGFRGVFGRKWL